MSNLVAKKLFFDIPAIGRVNAKDGTFNTGGSKRESVMADSGIVGYTEEPQAPTLSFKMPNTAGVDIDVLKDLTDINVNITDDNGKSWIMSGAWVDEPPELSGGEYDVKMTGLRADPIK